MVIVCTYFSGVVQLVFSCFSWHVAPTLQIEIEDVFGVWHDTDTCVYIQSLLFSQIIMVFTCWCLVFVSVSMLNRWHLSMILFNSPNTVFDFVFVFSSSLFAPFVNVISNFDCVWFSDKSYQLSNQAHNDSQSATVDIVPSPLPAPQHALKTPVLDAPPRNKKMPPLKAFRLTKELVKQRVKDNIIIVTFGNYAFMDFIVTWVKHLNDLGLSNYLVGEHCCF